MNNKVNIMMSITAASIMMGTSIGYAAEKGIVTTNDLNIRSGPGVSYSIVTKVNKDTTVTIDEQKNGWYKVTLSNGKKGWASASYIDIVKETASENNTNGEIINESVYLRETASWSAKKGEVLKVGTKVKVLANEGSWVKVEYNNNVGYISSDYVKMTVDQSSENNTNGEIINESVYLRETASWSAKKGEVLKVGTKVKVLANEGSWVKVEYNNNVGYISSDYVKVTVYQSNENNTNEGVGDSSKVENGEIINESVYLRETASWSAKKGEVLKVGTKVEILANEGSWVKVRYDDNVGYVGNNYIKILSVQDNTDRNNKINAVVSFAKKQLGKPYVYGDKGPNSFDCSGLLYYVFDNAAGIKLPRVSRDQAKVGIEVGIGSIEPGDIIAFDFNKDGNVTHVGMYVGDGKFIHALKPGTTVQLTSISQKYWNDAISTIRRVI